MQCEKGQWSGISAIIIAIAVYAGGVYAQPSPAELAERIDAAYAEYIRQVDHVVITSEITEGLAQGTVTRTRFEKSEKDGRPILKAVQDDDAELAQMTGMYDGMLADLVRHASAIERGQYEGKTVYVVTVDDADYLASIEDFQVDDELDASGGTPKKVLLWLDTREYIVHKLEFAQETPTGAEIEVSVLMDAYRTHRGLPVAHRSRMTISGMDQIASDPEIQQARRQMEQLQEQLATLPPEQRAMIEAQLGPQMEQFEQLISPDGAKMEIHVTDVSFE